jgi:hypothetical protein
LIWFSRSIKKEKTNFFTANEHKERFESEASKSVSIRPILDVSGRDGLTHLYPPIDTMFLPE